MLVNRPRHRHDEDTAIGQIVQINGKGQVLRLPQLCRVDLKRVVLAWGQKLPGMSRWFAWLLPGRVHRPRTGGESGHL